MSHHHSLLTDQGFAAPNLTQRCSDRISQALKHFTARGRTAPHTKCSQGSSQQETNTPIPKKPEPASSITHPSCQGLITGTRTSAGTRPGCWPPWSCQGLDCSPTAPLSHISQTLHFPSVVPCPTPDYTQRAPAFLTHLWEHLGTEDRTTLREQTCGQLQLQTLPVPPWTGTIPWNQHFLHSPQSFPSSR